jgi:sugar phosphate isomerase/epimerase
MKLTFTTLGCPNWDLATICKRGREYGFDGVDFRGYLGTIDITLRPEFTTGATASQRMLAEAGLGVSAISTSIKVCKPELLEENLEEARRTIGVAHALGTYNVRIYGDGDVKTPRLTLAKIGCDCIEQILALDGASSLHWLFETHDLWVKAADTKLLLNEIPNPAFGALWDMGHTSRVGGEKPADSFKALCDCNGNSRIGHIHVKDAVYNPQHPLAMKDGWRFVLPGEGQLPLAEAIAILRANGYDSGDQPALGWMMFEHEKFWHPELVEPEVALPAFITWARKVLANR